MPSEPENLAKSRPKVVRTAKVIAQEVGDSYDRVKYILDTREHIKPFAVVGRTRCYTSEAVAQVRYELNLIAARKSGGSS